MAARGRFVMAVSGGRTPWMMLRALPTQDVPWDKVHVFQVDERVAPAGHPDRNLTHLRASLLEQAPLLPITSMPCRWKSPIWKRCRTVCRDASRHRRLAPGARSGPSRSRV